MYLLVLNYFYVFQCSLLLREYVAAAVQFLLQIIKNTYRRSKQFSYEDYLQKQLNLHGIWIAVIIKSNYRYLYNGRAWIKKGLWQPEEDFFFVVFFFSSSSGTLRSMTIKRHGQLCPTRVTSLQLAINPTTYTSDCDSTSSGRHNRHHGNINLTYLMGHLTR